jgi:Patatin-like phospholipase
MSVIDYPTGGRGGRGFSAQLKLYYFEDVLPVELEAVNERRESLKRKGVRPLEPPPATQPEPSQSGSPQSRAPSPDPAKIFPGGLSPPGGGPPQTPQATIPTDPNNPDPSKTRPRPVPCDAIGLAFSGGGIRSAAVCLGALQALNHNKFLEPIDYLSTVSGGGYIGACLSAAMTEKGGGKFPFGDDVSDSRAVAHLRNYSNYLLPRGRSGVRNISEVAAVLLRGVLANAILVLAVLLFCALITKIAYPDARSLHSGSFVSRLLGFNDFVGASDFRLSLWLAIAVAIALTIWAVLRSFAALDHYTGDTKSFLLAVARILIVGTVISAFLDLQPLMIDLFIRHHHTPSTPNGYGWPAIKTVLGVLGAFSGTISLVSSPLSRFLKTTQRSRDWRTSILRGVTHLAIFLAGSCCRSVCGSSTSISRRGSWITGGFRPHLDSSCRHANLEARNHRFSNSSFWRS